MKCHELIRCPSPAHPFTKWFSDIRIEDVPLVGGKNASLGEMVREPACSGVMFTIDTESGFRDAVMIRAAYGVGENVVQGPVTPDEHTVFKTTLKSGHRPILQKTIGSKEFKLIYDTGGGKMVKNVPVAPGSRRAGDISAANPRCRAREWPRRGCESGQRARAGDQERRHIGRFQAGEVLVTDKTDPDWQPIMKKAAAIITNRGGRTCHAAIVSRELGVPAIVGTEHGTEALKDGQMVTVCCAEGETGFVYEDELPFDVERADIKSLGKPRTKVMMNLANPEEAFAMSFIPNEGAGLARMEFIISNFIKIHPLALIDFDQLADTGAQAEIEKPTSGCSDKPRFFVDKLAQCVAMVAAAFDPKDVILRLSDFKSNEYVDLFDGFSIGPNDLTQLILGVDRDSEIVAPIFDERNPAVKKMIAQVIATCRAKGRKIGIRGQAPSDYPEFSRFLVEEGIDSISLNPDTVLKTTLAVLATEHAIAR